MSAAFRVAQVALIGISAPAFAVYELAFQANTLSSTINSLNVALENVSSSESAITDTDFATETANLTRSQILVQSGTSVLAQSNQSPQSALALLPR